MAMQHTPLLMSKILDRGAQVAPNEEIVTATESGTRRQTYKQTRDRAHQLAHALAAAGIQVGDRVGTFMWNGSRHLEAYHACAGMGAVLHTLNIRLGEKDLEYIINHAEDKYIFVDAPFLPIIEGVFEKLKTVKGVIVLAAKKDIPESKIENLICYEELISKESTEINWPEFDEHTASSLCYTSGTTGNPKGALYSHRSTIIHAWFSSAGNGFNMTPNSIVLPVVPMFHVNAWGLPYAAFMFEQN